MLAARCFLAGLCFGIVGLRDEATFSSSGTKILPIGLHLSDQVGQNVLSAWSTADGDEEEVALPRPKVATRMMS